MEFEEAVAFLMRMPILILCRGPSSCVVFGALGVGIDLTRSFEICVVIFHAVSCFLFSLMVLLAVRARVATVVFARLSCTGAPI